VPRIPSQLASDAINNKTGEAPVLLVAINWGLGINWYSSRDVYLPQQFCPGVITSAGDISCDKRADNMGTVSGASLEFHDRDGLFKTNFDIAEIEGKPCSIFLGFEGLTTANAIPLLFGRIVGPISWSERTHKVTFQVESQLIDNEIGFSAEHGDFKDLAREAEGVPWPMIFGKCEHVPVLMIRKHTEGYLQYPIRLKSPIYKIITFPMEGETFRKPIVTNDKVDVYTVTTNEKNKIYVRGGANFPRNKDIQIIVGGVVFKGSFRDDNTPELFEVEESNLPKYKEIPIVVAPTDAPAVAGFLKNLWLADEFQGSIASHHCYFDTNSPDDFYDYCTSQAGQQCIFKYPFIDPATHKENKDNMRGRKIKEVYAISKGGLLGEYIEKINRMGRIYGSRNQETKVTQYLDTLAKNPNAFWTSPDDTPVRLWNTQDPDLYAVSITPIDTVDGVYAYRSVSLNDGRGKIKVLSKLPAEWYTIIESDYQVNGANVTALEFQIPLEDRDLTQEWEQQLYVTATSSIGPNTAHILEYLIKTYTELSINLGDTVAKLADYPSNFALFERKNAITICKEIAWQARCQLVVDSGVAFLKFMAEQPTSALGITKSNIDHEESVKLELTSTSEITTKLVGVWSETYKYIAALTRFHESDTNRITEIVRAMSRDSKRREENKRLNVYRFNVQKYGIRSRTEQIYIYNDEESVKRTIEFWGYRFANSWKKITATVMLPAVLLVAFDGVLVQLDDINIVPNVIGIVEATKFNYQSLSVTLTLWLPIRGGTNSLDNLAFPES
jgi:hypothetical protein